MNDIFIGYSSSDSAIAERLMQRFQDEGWQVFIDRQTPVGRKWHKEIERELHAARAVVVLWSAASRDSDFVLEEAEYAKRKNILFPAFIERVECPYGFGRIQTADLVGWDHPVKHTGLIQLLESLQVHLNGAGTEPLHSAAPTQPVLKPGQNFRDPLQSGGEGPLLTVIPAGRFVMGSPKDEHGRTEREGPQHEVIIAQPFALGVYAVTFGEYDRFCEITGREVPDDYNWGRKNRPVIDVSWHDAQAYCVWLCEQTGKAYRLPSEAEWEYACRAGTTTLFYTGETITSDQANFDFDEKLGRTLPVGSFAPNAFGLYDMHGNVCEWIQDCWHDNYDHAPDDGSAWLGINEYERNLQVVRGGSWLGKPGSLRSANRGIYGSNFACQLQGFRIVRVF